MTITEYITIETPGQSSSAADAVEFFPNPLTASVYPAKVLSIGQVAKFSSNPSSHFGSSVVLGRAAEVHFVAQSASWVFSDGGALSGADSEKSFRKAGKYLATASVQYSVSYRLLGETSWQPVSGILVVDSNPLEVLVGAQNFKSDQSSQGALLVGADCIGRSGSFGCGP
jgi:hypothetical protein